MLQKWWLKIEHFKVHHKERDPFVDKHFISSSLYLLFLCLHLHLFQHNYKCEEYVQFIPNVKI